MPGLYGNTTSYVVSATSVSTLYLGSTTTFTATTYSTNLAGLYGGSYAALPTNAAQLIQLFDNNGNVHFYLDPATNSSTIFANFVGTASIVLGNFQFDGNTVTNIINGPINLSTNGFEWSFDTNGSTSFPNYTFPSAHGLAGQVLADDGSGNLYWDTIEGGVTDLTAGLGIALSSNTGSITITNIGVTSAAAGTGIAVSNSTGSISITNMGVRSLASDGSIAVSTSTGSVSIANMGVRAITAGTGISVSTSTGTVNIVNAGVTSITAGTGTSISTSTGNITIWTAAAPTVSTAYDFGTILAPVSYTLDMGPIIV